MSIIDSNASLKAILSDVAQVAGYIWSKGWGERNGGNITVNVTETLAPIASQLRPIPNTTTSIGLVLPYIAGKYFYVKGTQKRMRDLAKDPMANGAIIRILEDGKNYDIIADTAILPTSELPSHLAIQNYLVQSGSRYKATLHTHPIEIVALSHHRQFLDDQTRPNHITSVLWSMIPETLAFAPLGLGVVPYQVPGSIALANATLEKIHDYDVVLWEKHGVFAVGQDIMDAFDQVDVLNKAARIYLDARSLGSEPEGMSGAQMKEVQHVFSLPASRPC
ncbi:MAG: rhamnulose-1-phosphate aldolase [Paludibacteraceae bacterium]|nr:rhamnulose-1-phosphate aldolase [Paludibacteraceae bacterium]